MTTKANSCAVLMPIASLMRGEGIGNYHESARSFIDELSELGVSYWQVLPLGKTDIYGCPYASPSAFGMSHLMIDEKLLGVEFNFKSSTRIDYQALEKSKMKALLDYAAKEMAHESSIQRIEAFKKEFFWAHDMAIFLSLKERNGDDWTQWHSDDKNFNKAEKKVLNDDLVLYNSLLLLESIAHEQWFQTMDYAHTKGIEIIGDVPIFVSRYSFDRWRWPNLFKVDEQGSPLVITGAPPDAFSSTGQLWGTLNYKWQENRDEVINWWAKRISYLLKQFDLLRIDHFIGLYHVWESPASAPDASFGGWKKSEGDALLERLQREHPKMPFIAEDLGALSAEVTELREKYKLPSMKVFQFAIGEDKQNEHLPQNVRPTDLLYSATHDNNTMLGWIESELSSGSEFKENLESCLQIKHLETLQRSELHKILLENVLSSKARTTIFQWQDIQGLGSSARINVPGTQEGNWNWRMTIEDQNLKMTHTFKELLHTHHRNSRKEL